MKKKSIPARLLLLLLSVGSVAMGTPSYANSDIGVEAATQNEVNLKVTVKDASGNPIIGATVISTDDASKGGISDTQGVVTIQNISSTSKVEISSLGYESQTIDISGRTNIDVTLIESAMQVDDVVVVGYGVQKKENLTGAITQVNMDEAVGDRPITSVASALQGVVPGLTITGGTEPGTDATFSIRGIASINGTGSPLILIDNVPGDINMLDPEDIESVSVLKDAASSAIYGARAAFGVILITTKKADKTQKTKISYSNNIAFESYSNVLEQATTEEIIKAMYDYRNDGKFFAQGQDLQKWLGYIDDYNNGQIESKYPDSYFNSSTGQLVRDGVSYYLKDQNHQDQLFESGFMHRHNLSASGGSKDVSYRMALGYFDKNGVMAGDSDVYDRLNVNSNINAKLTNWATTSLDFRYGNSGGEYAGRNAFGSNVPDFVPNEYVKSQDTETTYITNTPYNYLVNTYPNQWSNTNTRIYSNTVIKPTKGLDVIFEYTYDEYNRDRKSYSNNFMLSNLEQNTFPTSNTPTYENTKSNTAYNAINAYAAYTFSTPNQKHNMKFMAGYSQERSYYEELKTSRKEMIVPDLPSIGGAVGEILASDNFQDYAIRGAFYRFNYNYQNKYLLEVNGRYDGSSRFPTENRFGFFPSVSAGWQVGKEKFMEGTKNWLDEFKLRASWGQIGNQDIDNYQYIASMPVSQQDWIVDGQKVPGLASPSLVRQNFTWEVAESLNIGADFIFLKNRLRATFEWFERTTKDMLAPGLDLPGVVGTAAPLQNAADLRSRGWEISASWQDQVGDWSYNVGFNLYDGTTEIIKYDNTGGLLQFEWDGTLENYYVGQQLGEIWGYVNDGYYTIDDFQDGWQNNNWKLKEGVTSIHGNSGIRPGDVKFKDLDGDGTVYQGTNTLNDSGDRTVVGNTTPRYQFGINLGVNYKGWGLSAFLNGTGKRDAWLGSIYFPMQNGGSWGTLYAHHTDYWTPTEKGGYTPVNPNPEFPRIYNEGNNGSNYRVQDAYLANAAYVRLKNVTLSYTFPRAMLQKIGLTGAKVFFSGENLLTFDHLPNGFDPERISWGYPVYQTYSFGVSLTL